MEQDRRKAWGFTLFGDDLRVELGGKASFMGLYQHDMVFPNNITFPFFIPKLVAMVMYYELRGAIEEEPTFKISLVDESNILVEAKLQKTDAQKVAGLEHQEGKEETIFHARVPFILSPFQIDRPGRVRVRAHYEDGSVLKLGSLNIKTVAEDEFQGMLGIAPQK